LYRSIKDKSIIGKLIILEEATIKYSSNPKALDAVFQYMTTNYSFSGLKKKTLETWDISQGTMGITLMKLYSLIYFSMLEK
jgi:hypothetical protein